MSLALLPVRAPAALAKDKGTGMLGESQVDPSDGLTGGTALNAAEKTTHDWFFVDFDDIITNLKNPGDHVQPQSE